jgi:hypothetical protein
MEKKQQRVGNLPEDAPRANRRNTNTDEAIERVYEEADEEVLDSEKQYDENDSFDDGMKKHSVKNGGTDL